MLIKMPRPKKQLPQLPHDWDQDSLRYHGFSKFSARHCYRPVLSLMGVQHYFGECFTRREAAQAYDLLLRFFLPFTASRAVPNFPEKFFDLAQDAAMTEDCEGLWPVKKLLALEEELTGHFETLGRDVKQFARLRMEELQRFEKLPNPEIEAAEKQRRRALSQCEKLLLDLHAVPLERIFVDLNFSSTESPLMKDAGACFLRGREDLKRALAELSEFLKNYNAAKS